VRRRTYSRQHQGATLLTLLIAGALAALAHAQTQTGTDLLSLVGGRVRVMAPGVGEGWQVGLFNRLRVEPPCYRVLLIGADGRISATLAPRELTRIQVSTLSDGRRRSYNLTPDADLDAKETWHDLPLKALHEAERSCPVRP
jgi:hypothetical protein